MVKFSIITVTYNAKDTISATLDSVINQNYNDWESILIDGGSTDGTVEILTDYVKRIEEKGNKVTLVTEPDKGIYDAMNKGTDIARGKWISFLNAGDVYINKDVLSDIAFLEQKLSCGVIYGRSLTSTGREFATRPAWMLPYKKPFYHQASFIQCDVQKKYKFNLKYSICADFDMFQRAYLDKIKFCRVNTLIVKSDDKGVSKNLANRQNLIKQDLDIIWKNGIRWYNHPLILYYNYKRKLEMSQLEDCR